MCATRNSPLFQAAATVAVSLQFAGYDNVSSSLSSSSSSVGGGTEDFSTASHEVLLAEGLQTASQQSQPQSLSRSSLSQSLSGSNNNNNSDGLKNNKTVSGQNGTGSTTVTPAKTVRFVEPVSVSGIEFLDLLEEIVAEYPEHEEISRKIEEFSTSPTDVLLEELKALVRSFASKLGEKEQNTFSDVMKDLSVNVFVRKKKYRPDKPSSGTKTAGLHSGTTESSVDDLKAVKEMMLKKLQLIRLERSKKLKSAIDKFKAYGRAKELLKLVRSLNKDDAWTTTTPQCEEMESVLLDLRKCKGGPLAAFVSLFFSDFHTRFRRVATDTSSLAGANPTAHLQFEKYLQMETDAVCQAIIDLFQKDSARRPTESVAGGANKVESVQNDHFGGFLAFVGDWYDSTELPSTSGGRQVTAKDVIRFLRIWRMEKSLLPFLRQFNRTFPRSSDQVPKVSSKEFPRVAEFFNALGNVNPFIETFFSDFAQRTGKHREKWVKIAKGRGIEVPQHNGVKKFKELLNSDLFSTVMLNFFVEDRPNKVVYRENSTTIDFDNPTSQDDTFGKLLDFLGDMCDDSKLEEQRQQPEQSKKASLSLQSKKASLSLQSKKASLSLFYD